MRAEFERLRASSSVIGRLVYRVLKGVSQCLPATRREAIMTSVKRLVRYRPAFCRRVTEMGITAESRSPRVIISLTSYPARIKTVHRVIAALLHQTFKPDKVVLWLGEDKFPRREDELPRDLLRLRQFGLTIGWCKDIRSYTKLIPSLKAYPADIIVTADDDTFYGPEWLERLYVSYENAPHCIHSNLVRIVPIRPDGSIDPYLTWRSNCMPGHAAFSNFLLGYGGVLYPPHALDDEVFNTMQFQRLAPQQDDVWFWAMAVKRGTPICVVPNPVLPQCDIYANQQQALSNVNVHGRCLNDRQLHAVVEQYDLINRISNI